MNKHPLETEQEPLPVQRKKNHPLLSWPVIVVLLGAGTIPCPDCGMPLAWHLWPLALLILVARWIIRRKPKDPGAHPSPDPASEPEERRVS